MYGGENAVGNREISVVIPVYNVEKYIEETLDSVMNQTFSSYELILVDDCSNDESLRMIQEYEKRDSRITVVHLDKNRGAAYCRNLGLKMANGKYIIFLDADDIFAPDMLEKSHFYIEKYNLDVLKFKLIRFEGEWIPERYKVEGDDEVDIFTCDSPLNGVLLMFGHEAYTKLYRKSFLLDNDIMFQELPSNNDAFFTTISLIMAKRIGFLNKILLYYRFLRPGSITVSRMNRENYCIEKDKEVLSYLKRREISDDVYCLLYEHMVQELFDILTHTEWYSEKCRQNLRVKIATQNFLEERKLFSHSRNILHDIVKGTELSNNFLNYYTVDSMKALFREYEEKKIALWGCGKYGKFFLELVQKAGLSFAHVIDKKLCGCENRVMGYVVEDYRMIQDDIDIIFVSSSRIFREVKEEARGKEILDLCLVG